MGSIADICSLIFEIHNRNNMTSKWRLFNSDQSGAFMIDEEDLVGGSVRMRVDRNAGGTGVDGVLLGPGTR